MTRPARRCLPLLLLALPPGCFSVSLDDGQVSCDTTGLCPTGMSCASDGLCYAEPPTPDARVDAAAPDGAILDAAAGDAAAGDAAIQSVSLAIAASADDAEESPDGILNFDSLDLDLCNESFVAVRFVNVDIPAGARIAAAHLQLTHEEPAGQVAPCTVTIRAWAVDDAPALPTDNGALGTLPLTGASVSWSVAAWDELDASGPAHRSPDLSAVVQAIVDRPGWSATGALALHVTSENLEGRRSAHSYDSAAVRAPRLELTWWVP